MGQRQAYSERERKREKNKIINKLFVIYLTKLTYPYAQKM